MLDFKSAKNLIEPHKQPDKEFFLDLLDGDKQTEYEHRHISALMFMLKFLYIRRVQLKINSLKKQREDLKTSEDSSAEKYKKTLEINAEIARLKGRIEGFKPFFDEPYFARMDVTDDKEGYNSYYIGKRGDEGLEIVDWRAPLARKYYQKSRTSFSINEYDYKLILRRALRTKSGKVLDIKNEYLSLSDYLSKEEIGGRNEELIFDPFLKEILQSRKEKSEVLDIIETIQEQQFEIITLPERDEFVLQGVAGSGKTMILLHRLSYIMYNNESIKPSDVLVITPSDSFNAFIDELSQVLELERVKTSTIDRYFIKMLKSAGVDIDGKIGLDLQLPPEYASFIYSQAFVDEVGRKLSKIYDSVFGLFASSECAFFATAVNDAAGEQIDNYEWLKNSSLRVRRCVLGEIKEKQGGGLYYTKQFRYLFNCVLDVREFLALVEKDERMKEYAFFYNRLLVFYKSLRYIRRNAYKICHGGIRDLTALKATVEKEIGDLGRYKIRTGESETLTYSAQIEKREQLKNEIDAAICRVETISSRFAATCDFADVLRGEVNLSKIGKCENTLEIARFFNKEILRKIKRRLGVQTTALLRCDAFALCHILVTLGYNLSPKHAFVFVDEAQDISPAEYAVLKKVNDRAIFNIFGDLKQNITPYRGVKDWGNLGYKVYTLGLNYRNTNEIVEYVAEKLGIDMRAIGLNGAGVERISKRSVAGWLSEKNGLKAVICAPQSFEEYRKKSYNVIGQTGKISKTKINIMTVYESKGLEFTAVAVADEGMSDNEKYVAYTRALKHLAIME
ncbi:MAG: AAA family ATPase [Clostridiales bacterium]|nr:AAA family ATPase [Clostridiales bacterium]